MQPKNNKTSVNNVIDSSAEDFSPVVRKDRTSVAWLLAAASLVATVAIAIGGYYGGRAVLHKLTNKTSDTVATSQNTPVSNQPAVNTVSDQTITNPTTTVTAKVDSTSKPTTTPATSVVTSTPTVVVAPPTPTPTVVASSSSTPVATSTKITNTGPGNSLAIFLVVSLFASLLHSRYSRRKFNY